MKRHPILAAVLAVAAMLLVAWLVRFRVATAIVDRRLAGAGVPASYRITQIGPFLERMEDVKLGDPAAPDLIARRVDVTIGYGFTGPAVRAIRVEGFRLRGRYDARGASFGVLDRLLPKAGGKAGLPNLPLSIRDAELALATPAGAISVALAGEGNPAHRFRGDARLAALSLSASGCVARDVAAVLKIGSDGGKPYATGPARVGGLACPQRHMSLGQGAAQIALSSDAHLERLTLDANLAGFGGRVQAVRFASINGAVSGSRSASGFGVAAKFTLNSASAPDFAKIAARSADIAVGTPLGPVAHRAARALASLLDQADATAALNIASIAGQPLKVRVNRLELSGANGANMVAIERGGLSWSQAGPRTDADIAMSGGDLPRLAIQLHQAAAGAPLAGHAVLQPYRVGSAGLAATPVRFSWDGKRAGFQTVLTIDGPIGDGFVRGLIVPVNGYATVAGGLAVDQGCANLAFRQLLLSSFTFDAARIPICGRPIVSRSPTGLLRIDAVSQAVRLTGRTTDGSPVTLNVARVRLTQAGFAAEKLDAVLGGEAQPTHLAVATLDATLRGGRLSGSFERAAGGIGNVPLAIAEASGSWTLNGGALQLTGKLGVSDMDAVARFRPLVTNDATLSLRDGVILATATLLEPVSARALVDVSLEHRLSSGTGHAVLDVPGITFAPKGLQPDNLTPLTLGVIANVAGTIAGSGRIDWNQRGVTSTGNFGTERIDLAAAFGPVTGIRGQIHFTDLLGLVSAAHQKATVAEVNPGVSVTNGVAHYQLIGGSRVQVEDARWPFAGGDLRLDPTMLDFGAEAERHLTFRIAELDAAAFIQQLDFPNISATGTFDGVLPMIFDQQGGRIESGSIKARGTGTLAYIGPVSNADLGTMGKLAFDALKAIRYSALDISLDGRLDGEMVSVVRFTGVREATPEQSFVTRLIRNLPFRFNIAIRAPFRGLVGSARAYIDPRLLLNLVPPKPATQAEPPIQHPASGATP